MPTATMKIARMLQANTRHADFVHARIVLSLSFQGDQRQATTDPGRRRDEPVRKERDLRRRHFRQRSAPHRLHGATTRQPQQHHTAMGDPSGTHTTLRTAAAMAAAATLRTTAPTTRTTRARRPRRTPRRRHQRPATTKPRHR